MLLKGWNEIKIHLFSDFDNFYSFKFKIYALNIFHNLFGNRILLLFVRLISFFLTKKYPLILSAPVFLNILYLFEIHKI